MLDTKITLTDSAVKHLQKTLQKKTEALGIRFGVKNAGCSGMSYVLDFALETKADDHIFETAGIKVVVDPLSLEYVQGTEIDCVEDELNASLKFNNPNVKSACGCGESFNIEK
jgi:iron-sulfur cluster assembly protein